MKQEEVRIMREDRKEELKLNFEERHNTSVVLKKLWRDFVPRRTPRNDILQEKGNLMTLKQCWGRIYTMLGLIS